MMKKNLCGSFSEASKKIAIIFFLAVLFAGIFLWSCRDNDENIKLGIACKIQPDIPSLDLYDAVIIGENHFSAQIYDIELNLMRYYYSLGIRDFAFECSFAEALFLQYYFNSGDENCYAYLTRYSASEKITPFNKGRADFYRNIYQWNSNLNEKIIIHGFDVEHDPYDTGIAATWFFILKNYDHIEGIPLFSGDGIWERVGNWYRLIDDFRNNRQRYSQFSKEDTELFMEIILNIEQGLLSNNWSGKLSKKDNQKRNAILREQFMIENFRNILDNAKNRKVFAIMGYMHSALTGNTIYPINESQFPWVSTDEPCLANVLKDEVSIASIVLRTFNSPNKWPYFIRIKGWELAEPYKSKYSGNWPLNQ